MAKPKEEADKTEVPEKKAAGSKKVAAEKKPAAEKKEAPAPAAVAVEAPAPEAKPATKSVKVGKLLPKNKSRLPRKEKKAKQRAAGRL